MDTFSTDLFQQLENDRYNIGPVSCIDLKYAVLRAERFRRLVPSSWSHTPLEALSVQTYALS